VPVVIEARGHRSFGGGQGENFRAERIELLKRGAPYTLAPTAPELTEIDLPHPLSMADPMGHPDLLPGT
jgi:hypothetical protein